MIILTIDEVITIHDKLITTTGGSPGLRDVGLLESAVLGCVQSISGEDIYPTVVEKAARMAFSIYLNSQPIYRDIKLSPVEIHL